MKLDEEYLSACEEYIWLSAAQQWQMYEIVSSCQSALNGFVIGLCFCPVLVLTLGAWWSLGAALVLIITEHVLLSPYVKRKKIEITAAWSIQCGMRCLCGSPRQ